MLTVILSFLSGVVGPLLPELLKFFRQKQDNAHELAMLEARMKYAQFEHMWRMEEINANADIAESQVLHGKQQSFGVQLLDASQRWADSRWGKWLVTPAFYLFSLLDFLNGMVRPVIAYAAFGFYMAYKVALYQIALRHVDAATAVLQTWGDNDWAVLMTVIGFFFGQRMVKAAFGGSAQTTKANG